MIGEVQQDAAKTRLYIGYLPESCIVVEINEIWDRDCAIGNANHSWADRAQTCTGTLTYLVIFHSFLVTTALLGQ